MVRKTQALGRKSLGESRIEHQAHQLSVLQMREALSRIPNCL